jgi:hypothetical protein
MEACGNGVWGDWLENGPAAIDDASRASPTRR